MATAGQISTDASVWPHQLCLLCTTSRRTDTCLLAQKIRIYQALVQSVLLYAAETWTPLATDIKALEAFHIKCQRQLQQISWQQFISVSSTLELQVVTYNLHGFNQGQVLLNNLCDNFDIIAVQEHWLTDHDLNKFCIFVQIFKVLLGRLWVRDCQVVFSWVDLLAVLDFWSKRH